MRYVLFCSDQTAGRLRFAFERSMLLRNRFCISSPRVVWAIIGARTDIGWSGRALKPEGCPVFDHRTVYVQFYGLTV